MTPSIIACRNSNRATTWPVLLAVRHPDIFHLRGVLQEPTAFALHRLEPVDGAPFISEDLLQVSGRKRFCCCRAGLVTEAPDGIHVLMLGKDLEELRTVSRDNVDGTSGQIAGVEELIQVPGDERISFRR